MKKSASSNLLLDPLPPSPKRAGHLLVIGAAVLDRIFYVPELPVRGETVIGTGMEVHPGGKGANQALAAGKMRADVRFLTSVGSDEAAEIVLEPLENAGIDCKGVFRFDDSPTAEALIAVDEKGENQIVACPGAYHRFMPEMVREREQDFRWAEWLLIQNELPRPTIEEAIRLAILHDTKVFFNPAPFRRQFEPPPRGIEVLAPNEIEAAMLLGVEDYLALPPHDRPAIWKELGAKNVIVTLGKQGGEWFDSSGSYQRQASFEVEAVDTVGAGDAFCGILAALLVEGIEMEPAIRISHYGAALSTTKRGAQEGLPSREDLLYMYS